MDEMWLIRASLDIDTRLIMSLHMPYVSACVETGFRSTFYMQDCVCCLQKDNLHGLHASENEASMILKYL